MKNINFIKPRYIFISISLAVIALSLVFMFVKGFNFGVDFKGGTSMTVSFSKTDLTAAEVRGIFEKVDSHFSSASISRLHNLKSTNSNQTRVLFNITVGEFFNAQEKSDLVSKVEKEAQSQNTDVKFESFQTVSGYAAAGLRKSATWASLVAITLLLIYMAFRFQFIFGVGALAALVHDLTITAGLYSMFWIRFDSTVVAALLTLLGYSLNDTVVVYSRIRENLKKMRGKPMAEIVNVSINQTLSRTINTSFTTFLVVFILLLFSSSVLKPFAFGMSFGVITGTYSSIYIASPILIGWLEKRRKKSALRR
jgi:preprotein translocase subunit SecF